MDRVWVRGKPSRKVIESADVHYFYWKIETGLSHITFSLGSSKYRIPVFFLKANDYEPAKRLDGSSASRFHHRILTLFKKPRIMNGRPVVEFLTRAHVPVFLSEPPKRVRTDIDMQDLGFEETWSLPILLQLLKQNCWKDVRPDELNDYSALLGTVPQSAVFDPAKLNLVVEVSQ
jgi:hypothetical protein